MMSSSSTCPFCDQIVQSSELQRHANSHFEDEDEDYYRKQQQVARDLELACQIALSSPPSHDYQVVKDLLIESETSFVETSDARNSSCDLGTMVKGDGDISKKVSCLVKLQVRSPFYSVQSGLMTLLRNCLELESDNTTSILSGYVDHFQSIESEDVGWGCGWRNIQMLSSHLLMERAEVREILFGGSGFVPDIPSLQRWLEIAWERGFDVHGSNHFNHRIYGKKNWIGATECAALFRSFGLRAKIGDFGPKEYESFGPPGSGTNQRAEKRKLSDKGKRKAVQVYGPMDKYLSGSRSDVPPADSDEPGKSRNRDLQLADASGSGRDCDNITNSKSKGHQVLIDWVWNYFFGDKRSKFGHPHVFVSEKSPLYFQHDGHSRTIVGIQVKYQSDGMQQYNLLILDPAHRTEALERSLRENNGWQRFIKRGVHTLKKPQYQLCYIYSGIAGELEMERLKTIDSTFFEF